MCLICLNPINSFADLDVKRYGVIVSRGSQRGLLLPNLEGVDTPEQQVEIALKKAGIPLNKKDYKLERFEGGASYMKDGLLCTICPQSCIISEGHKGFCGARSNQNNKIVSDNYGKITSIALDPIEKKPLRHFMPGNNILSVGSFGCNLSCSFCQNFSIAKEWNNRQCQEVMPKQLVDEALELVSVGNIGLAYTYNEPLIGFEFILDCAKLAKGKGLKNVVVTNGYINPKPLQVLLPYIDAFNIDLKGFTETFYRQLGGELKVVKDTITKVSAMTHTEVTTLIIPGKNDSPKEMKALASWLSQLNEEIPLHISRFFPAYQMLDQAPTPVETVQNLAEIARQYLKYVYVGNV